MGRANIPNGCVLLARKIEESPIWNSKPSWWLKVWIHILTKVNHKKQAGFDRGENFFSRKSIHESCCLRNENIKQETVDNVLRWLKRTTQITTRKTTRGQIIKVVNYDRYQNIDNYRHDTKDDRPDETGTRQERDGNETINNNDKKEKKEKKKSVFSQTDFEKILISKKINANPLLFNELLEFFKYRKEGKSLFTERAAKLLLNELQKISSTEKEAIEILQKSIMNNWKGIFPIKGGGQSPHGVSPIQNRFDKALEKEKRHERDGTS